MMMRPWLAIGCVAMWASLVAADASGAPQGRPNRPRAGGPLAPLGPDPRVSPGEIQRLFDAYVVMQAQQALELTDQQYGPFLSRVRALQDVRRRADVERTRRIQVLRQTTNDPASNDNDLWSQLKELRAFNERTAGEISRAEDSVNEALTVRQQARYHLFQEMMERRKVDLLMRARQASRLRPPQE
ncbi:MAG: hypothetical protein ABL961_11535 [Vicinamibacterales bacterium]